MFCIKVIFHSKKHIRALQTVDYISDVHIDTRNEGDVPNITNIKSPICIVAGDIGTPSHKNFTLFLDTISKQYDDVCFIPGNHDFDVGCCYIKKQVNDNTIILKQLIGKYNNIHYLNCDTFNHKSGLIIAGCTLWSNPIYIRKEQNVIDHLNIHLEHVNWLENIIINNKSTNKLILASHYVPTFDLIESKYKNKYTSNVTSYFASDLTNMFDGFDAWICGHTHSKLEKHINGIYFGVNAIGHNAKKFDVKTINLSNE